VEVEQPAPLPPIEPVPAPLPPIYIDNSGESPSLIGGYWTLRCIVQKYFDNLIKKGVESPRKPSSRKLQRIFELTVGPHYNSTARLLEVIKDMAQDPDNNQTILRARRILASILQQKVKDQDLHNFQFHEDEA